MTAPGKAKGFTLVELLVVLVVIGLLVAVAPLTLNRVVPSLELRTKTRELAAALRNARGAAIRDNREAALTLDVEANWYRLDGRAREQAIPSDIELKLLTATSELEGQGAGRVRFFPDGSSTGGQITLARGDDTYYILIDWLSGRVEITDKVAE